MSSGPVAIGDFEMTGRDGLARLGKLETAHGTIHTPALMPVVNPNITVVPPSRIRALGGEVVITNSYIILKSEALRAKALAAGVHSLIGWDGPLMTDSGTFQGYVYGDVDVKPEEIVEFQKRIGSDIGTALDVFSVPDLGEKEASGHVEETLRRVKMTLPLAGGNMVLAATVQGSTHPALRAKAAAGLSAAGAGYLAFGGVVPMMETYRFADLVDVVAAAKSGASPALPVHLFGCGHPMLFPLAALLGCDVFDSAAYHKYARDGRMVTPNGTVMLDDLEHSGCACAVCVANPPGELRKKFPEEKERLLAEHNLAVSFAEIRRVRQAIAEESLWELVERRCRSHPALLSALRRLPAHAKLFDEHEPLSRRGAIFYTGRETLDRPALRAYGERLKERFRPQGRGVLAVVDEVPHPYRVSLAAARRAVPDASLLVRSPAGPVPLELDGIYPVCHATYPEPATTREDAREASRKFVEALRPGFSRVVEDLSSLAGAPSGQEIDLDRATVHATVDYQFGWECTDLLLEEPLRFVKSRASGRVRNVFSREEHVLSIRAHDGLCTLKLAGARRMLPTGLHRVIIEEDAAPFVKEGKNVFAKFVRGADKGLRVGDEAIIATRAGEVAGVGRTLMTPEEMRAFRRGVAVRTRDGARKEPPEPGDDGE